MEVVVYLHQTTANVSVVFMRPTWNLVCELDLCSPSMQEPVCEFGFNVQETDFQTGLDQAAF